MTVTADTSAPSRARRTPPPAKAPAAQGAKSAPPAAPSRRRGVVPLTPMRQETAKRIRTLARQVQESHPDMTVHDHLRDAAKTLEAGNEEGAQRHLRAAMFSLTPQSLHRNGLFTDDAHTAARGVMHSVHRHLLLVKDISDAGEKNRAAIAKLGGEDDTAPRPAADPNNGYGPGALAQKPTARQPPGNQALNAPNRADGGGSDPAAADPDGPQLKGSKQFTTRDGARAVTELAYDWNDLAAVVGRYVELAGRPRVINLVGPHGYEHNWVFVGIPAPGSKVRFATGHHASGTVEKADATHVHVRMADGSTVRVPHNGKPGPGKLAPASASTAAKAAPAGPVKPGEHVRVTSGYHAGKEGHVRQVAGNNVVVRDDATGSNFATGKDYVARTGKPAAEVPEHHVAAPYTPRVGDAVHVGGRNGQVRQIARRHGQDMALVSYPVSERENLYGGTGYAPHWEPLSSIQPAKQPILTGSHPADKLTVSANPKTTAKGMSDEDLKSADAEFSRRAALLGKPGQVSKMQKAVRAEMASRGAASGGTAKAGRTAATAKRDAGSAAGTAGNEAAPFREQAGAARKLAADARAAGAPGRASGYQGAEARRITSADALEEAAAHFDAGRGKEALGSLLTARTALSDHLTMNRKSLMHGRTPEKQAQAKTASGLANRADHLYTTSVSDVATHERMSKPSAPPNPDLLPVAGAAGKLASRADNSPHRSVSIHSAGKSLGEAAEHFKAGRDREGINQLRMARKSAETDVTHKEAQAHAASYRGPEEAARAAATAEEARSIAADAAALHEQAKAAYKVRDSAGALVSPGDEVELGPDTGHGPELAGTKGVVDQTDILGARFRPNGGGKALHLREGSMRVTSPGGTVGGKRLAGLRDADAAAAREAKRPEAVDRAKNIRLHESTGLNAGQVLDEGTLGTSRGTADVQQAREHLLNGDYQSADQALARAADAERAPTAPGTFRSAQEMKRAERAAGKIDTARARITRATKKPKATQPALSLLGRDSSGTVHAVDEHGRDYQMRLGNGQVTVTRGGQTLSAPAGEDPNMTARRLAAQLAGTSLAYSRNDRAAIELSAQTAALEVTPAPYGKPGGPGLYGVAGNKHSDYMEQVVQALMRRGMDKGKASAIARGSLEKWAARGGHVTPEVRAAAQKALAEEAAAAAKAHAHAVTRDDVARVVALASSGGHHVPGTDYEWEHNYVPLTHAAAGSHFKGSVPKSWHPRSGGSGKAAGPQHLKFTDGSGKVSYHTIHDEGTVAKVRGQAQQRKLAESASGPADLSAAPKNAQALHKAATDAGWNTSYYPGSSSDNKFDAQGREIPGSGTPLHTVSAHNPVTGQTVRQSWTGRKLDTYNQGEPLQASIAKIQRNPVAPEGLKALGTPAGRQARTASRIGEDATEFSARGSGTNAQKVGYLMGQASEALRSGDKQTAIRHLKAAQSASVTGREVSAHGLGYASSVIGKHLKSLGVEDPQLAYSWDDLARVVELATVLEFFNPAEARIGAGAAGGGQFTTGGGGQAQPKGKAPAKGSAPAKGKAPAKASIPVQGRQQARAAATPAAPAKPDAHQQHIAHVAHLNHVSTAKAKLMVTAQDDRKQAAALEKQRNALEKALQSASGKTSSGQAGATTSANATTKTTAPAASTSTASTSAASAGASTTSTSAPSTSKTSTSTASAASAPKAGSAAAMKAQIAQLNTQINNLIAAAKQAETQAAAMK